jgi:hypothetical protein
MATRRLRRVNQFLTENPAFTNGQVRWWIFNSADNGLDEAEAIVRMPRRVFIDIDRFFEWLDHQQHHRQQHRGAA